MLRKMLAITYKWLLSVKIRYNKASFSGHDLSFAFVNISRFCREKNYFGKNLHIPLLFKTYDEIVRVGSLAFILQNTVPPNNGQQVYLINFTLKLGK